MSDLEEKYNKVIITISEMRRDLEHLKSVMKEMQESMNQVLTQVMSWNGKMVRELRSYVLSEEYKELEKRVDILDDRLNSVEKDVSNILGRLKSYAVIIGIVVGVFTTVIAGIIIKILTGV